MSETQKNPAFRVLITDPIHPVCEQLLRECAMEPVVAVDLAEKDVASLIPTVEAWIIRSGTSITEDLIERARCLRVIGRAGVGVDNVDLDAATRKGVLVLNAPAGNTISTAEHTMALLLALSRRIAAASMSLRSGEWNRKAFTGTELFGKTLGIVGAGKIGKAVAERARAFGMHILAYDPVLAPEVADGIGISLVPMDTLLEESDFITVHTPLNTSTRGLIDAEALSKCKSGVGVINCARGGIIDEIALLEALNSGLVGGAALDVFTSEPPSRELHELLSHDRVVATPHIAASTSEAQEKVARQVTEQVIHALRNEPVSTAVNLSIGSSDMRPEIRPYLSLATRLGVFVSRLMVGRVKRILVGCRGEMLQPGAALLEVAVLKGFLSTLSTSPVNYINAPILAREAGLHSGYETHPVETGFSSRLDVEVLTDEGSIQVSGTVFGENEPLLVRINEFRLEVRPEGVILLYRNNDRPGMLASVGAVLARNHINIASLALGRKMKGEDALTAINVDENVPDQVLEEIRALHGIFDIHAIEL